MMLRHPSDFHRTFLCAKGPLIPSASDRSRAGELKDRIGVPLLLQINVLLGSEIPISHG